MKIHHRFEFKFFFIPFILLSFFFLGCQAEQESSPDSNTPTNGSSTPLSDDSAVLALGGSFSSYKSQTRGVQSEKSSRALNTPN